MNDTNPQIEAHLNGLADICCDILAGNTNDESKRCEQLLKSLLMSGYVWRKRDTFQADLERRVKSRCHESTMRRGEALSALSGKLATQFDKLATWESKTPHDDSPPKAANISSATDS